MRHRHSLAIGRLDNEGKSEIAKEPIATVAPEAKKDHADDQRAHGQRAEQEFLQATPRRPPGEVFFRARQNLIRVNEPAPGYTMTV